MKQPKIEEVATAPGKLAEVWFGVTEEIKSPRAVRIADAAANRHYGGMISLFVNTNCWSTGLMYVEPNNDTSIFSIENEDDGTADEWYGPTQEFYFILAGEFTVQHDTDAARMRRRESPSYVVHAGEYAVHPVGWKYQIRCTSKTPGTFLWCKHIPEGIVIRERLQVPIEP